jgi:outer membrane receptor for ferrienterochelin and colicin
MEEVQFQSGGFSAEYGNVNGGVVNTTTRIGGDELKIGAETIFGLGASDGLTEGIHSYGYNLSNFSVSGPISDNIKFFVNVEQRGTDDLILSEIGPQTQKLERLYPYI